MAFIACKENIVNRHRNGLPSLKPTAKAGHTLLAVNSLTLLCGDYVRNHFTMSSDHYRLASLDLPEKFCEACLGFCGLHRLHCEF